MPVKQTWALPFELPKICRQAHSSDRPSVGLGPEGNYKNPYPLFQHFGRGCLDHTYTNT